MTKPFNVYQALNASCKKYKFSKDEKDEIWRRVLDDKPYDRGNTCSDKYRAVMGYAKQLRKELDERINGTKMLHTPESEAICKDISRMADEVRQEKANHNLLATSILVASIMDEL